MKTILVLVGLLLGTINGFSPSHSFTSGLKKTHHQNNNNNHHHVRFSLIHNQPKNNRILPNNVLQQSSSPENNEKSSVDVMMGKVNIPDEYKEEIFRAEANTPAAKDRNTRVAIFSVVALLCIGISSFNAFLSNMRDGSDLTPINELGFGWVSGNPLFSFLFLNKFGGGLALLTAGLSGTMVELEQRTKNDNAEKIWAELQRRKSQGGSGKSQSSKKKTKSEIPQSKKKMSKKSRKRLDALSEVIIDDDSVDETTIEGNMVDENDTSVVAASTENDDNGGFFGKMKEFYDKADSMAQSQALLLNKELEDRGVVEKITDETGLKVIGREEAAKLENKDKDSEK